MDDTLRACQVLWRDSPAAFNSDTVSFRDIRCFPQPIREGGIPIWVGGDANERNVSRIAELAVGWMPILTSSSPELAAGIERLRAAFGAVGRDPETLQVRAGLDRVRDAAGNLDLDATLAGLEKLGERGVTQTGVGLEGFVRSADEVRPFLEQVGAAASRIRLGA
jgi:alkanesulfonate monooxygenase SsuD/methylene tetrahydromethanopterin reductase-like flavin-dependent oxidoreductase (luciferase family)